jgi:hypothetical protein
MNGSETLSALAYATTAANIKVNTFGADNTDRGDGDNDFGWRVGIFAAGSDITEGTGEETKVIADAIAQDSSVNILGAKLGAAWSITDGGIATATLGDNQGSTNADYARAFALGKDFQIYIGGRVDPKKVSSEDDGYGFIPVLPNGKTNVVNIIGAISRGKDSSGTDGSSLTVDSGWTVNTFGPVEDIKNIALKNGVLNAYGSLKNIALTSGTLNAFAINNGIGTIELKGGSLCLSKDDSSSEKFSTAIGSIAEKMTYVDPSTKTSYKGSENKIAIDTENFPWESGTDGNLVLQANDILSFHVDSSQPDPTVRVDQAESLVGTDDGFELTKGYVTVAPGIENAITFNGGKLAIVNDDTSSPGTLPAHADFWLVRSPANADIEKMFVFPEHDNISFEKTANGTYKLPSNQIKNIFDMTQANGYAEWNCPPDLYLFSNDESSGLYLGTGETPRYAVPSTYALDHANEEIAGITIDANDTISDAIFDRMTSVKGCLADPFIHVLYGQGHQNEILGFGYNNKAYGFALGADNI